MDDVAKLEQILKAECPCISIVTQEEEYALEVIHAAAMGSKYDLMLWSESAGIRGGMFETTEEDKAIQETTENPNVALVMLRQVKPRTISVLQDMGSHLKNLKTRRLLRDLIAAFKRDSRVLILLDHETVLPEVILSHARDFELSLPDETEIRKIVKSTLRKYDFTQSIDISISKKGYEAIIRNLRGLTRQQVTSIITETITDDNAFTDEDLNIVLANKRQLLQRGGLLEYIQTPLSLDEIGGMNSLKQWLRHRKQAFKPEARDFGLEHPKGVLMLGVQGAGKSLCAKAIATAWQQPLLRMDPSKLYASYIGQSERNLNEALRQTEMMSPVILWIDEIEKAFASAASRSSDGGLSQRMFGTLLTWMQDHTDPVFVIATANDIEALPPELLRKGRFDEIFFVDLPAEKVRKKIFDIHLSKRKRDPEQFDLVALARATQGYSGAEIEQVVISGLHDAFGQRTEPDTDLFLEVIQHSVPLSVTMAEKMEALRHWASTRCVPAD